MGTGAGAWELAHGSDYAGAIERFPWEEGN